MRLWSLRVPELRLSGSARPNQTFHFGLHTGTQHYQWLGICWGVTPFRVPHADTLETMVTHVETALTAATTLKGGDQVVVISGFPVGAFTSPNLAMLYTLKG